MGARKPAPGKAPRVLIWRIARESGGILNVALVTGPVFIFEGQPFFALRMTRPRVGRAAEIVRHAHYHSQPETVPRRRQRTAHKPSPDAFKMADGNRCSMSGSWGCAAGTDLMVIAGGSINLGFRPTIPHSNGRKRNGKGKKNDGPGEGARREGKKETAADTTRRGGAAIPNPLLEAVSI